MKKLTLLIPVLLLTVAGCAQDFFWGFNLFPNYSDRRLIVTGVVLSDEMIGEIEARETGKFSVSGGGLAGWRGEKTGFQFGVSFSETGYQTVKEPIPADDPAFATASERRFIYRNFNLEIPLEILFIHDLDDRNDFFFMLGGAGSVNLFNRTTEIRYAGDSRERINADLPEESFRPFNFAFQAGMGWEHGMGGSSTLFIQPNFQFWLSGLLQDADINWSLYNIGMKAGMKFYRE